ncbi:MAG TPA: cysteine desulfurase [Anaeromyxobacteraceae bacterium]|nr:cysteine desulfurase [Anaeromyxobacteraceae bacterium]
MRAAEQMTAGRPALDVDRVRAEFPILSRPVRGKRLVFLDTAASAQAPRAVIDAVRRYREEQHANVHRGVHYLSEVATAEYEAARVKIARFLNAPSAHEVIFTHGTTEALNLAANTLGKLLVGPGDEVLVSAMEHHSNIVPWHMLCAEKGAKLVVAPMDDRGALLLDELERRISPRTKVIAVAHVSNALGTVNPVAEIAALGRARGVPVVVDGAQAVAHAAVDVQALGCDFYAFSGHKVYGPTGIGALWGRAEWLDRIPPWQGGGDMILSVAWDQIVYNKPPFKFEAGTPNMDGAIGLGAALDWVAGVGRERVAAHEADLLAYGTERLSSLPGVRIVGTAPRKAGVLSFVMDDVHPHDIGTILDREGIAIRTGHHCAQPVMKRFGIPATARASFGVYNGRDDVDALVAGIEKVRALFA